MGDSLTAGYGVDPSEAYPALLQKKVDEEKLPYEVVGAGVSGDTTAGGKRRLAWAMSRGADVLVIALGGNDGLRGIPVRETEANLRAMVEEARRKNGDLRIVIAGMRMPDNMGEEFTKAFAAMYPKVASELNVELIPFLLDGVGGVVELNLPDGIHPNPAGHRKVAETVWGKLRGVLEAKKGAGEGA